jgi:IMP dehydrogenase
MKTALTYDDVLLVPQYSNIQSRSEVNLTNRLGENIFSLPIISSPMDTVTGVDMAITMNQVGGLGIIHRYNTIEEQAAMVRTAPGPVGAAVGVTGDFEKRCSALYDAGARVLCVDVAHGHHILMERTLKTLKDIYGRDVHLMAGNVATLEGFNDLADWGADSIRCNIGGGSICTTRVQTGHGVSGLQTIFDCAKSDRDAKIIADGGIKNSGDIVKAFAAGADFVMLGSLLAGTDETPGKVFDVDGVRYKTYRGMASPDAQVEWRNRISSREGISSTVPHRGGVKEILKGLVSGIRSGFSYSGARNIQELRTKAQWVQQTGASQVESSPHILRRNSGNC